MSDMPPHASSHDEDDGDLEFKPWVKITTWVALGMAALGLAYYAFYTWGYAVGRKETAEQTERSLSGVLQVTISAGTPVADMVAQRMAATRAEVEKSRSEKESAESQLTEVLCATEENNEALMRMAADRAALFACISRTDLRREAQGVLLNALIDRDLSGATEAMLDEVMPPAAPQSEVWAQRMLKAAAWLTRRGKWEKARAYLEALDSARGGGEVLRVWAEMALSAHRDAIELQRELHSLLDRAESRGSAVLSMEISVILGQLCRELGDDDRAREHFIHAVEAVAQAKPTAGTEALFYGVALYEVGELDAATEQLKAGLDSTARLPQYEDYRVIALRHLATICTQRARYTEALGYLYRAEGEATGCIPADSPFWIHLADQTGWLLQTLREYEPALARFRAALVAAGERDALRIHPLEGVVAACLSLGRSEEAIAAAEECIKLRESCTPEDTKGLGLACLQLGRAFDQAGRLGEAGAQYTAAVPLLPRGSSELTDALESRAQVCAQTGAWESAAAAWTALAEALPESAAARREAAVKSAEECRRKMRGESAAPQEKQDVKPRSAPARPARRRSRR